MIRFEPGTWAGILLIGIWLGVHIRDGMERWPEPVVQKQEAGRDQAPIYSNKCARQGKGFIAKQADGGAWTIRCTEGPRT